MHAKINANGRERKTLASQIDRLDTLLDGLADSLNEAVAQAVQTAVAVAVAEAVKAVLTEVLTNPAVLANLRAAAQAAQPEQPDETPAPKGQGRFASWRDWVGTKLKEVGERCKAGCQRMRDAGISLARRVARMVSTTATAVRDKAVRVVATGWLMGNFLLRLAVAFGSGVAVSIALFFIGIILASAPSELRAVILSTIARTIVWLRQLVQAMPWWAARQPAWQEI